MKAALSGEIAVEKDHDARRLQAEVERIKVQLEALKSRDLEQQRRLIALEHRLSSPPKRRFGRRMQAGLGALVRLVRYPQRLVRPGRRRILYVLYHYPQLSETYIKTELRAVRSRYDITIASMGPTNMPDPDHYPYRLVAGRDGLLDLVREIKPSVMHTHYLINAGVVAALSAETNIPFTIRAHSFDVLSTSTEIPEHHRGLRSILENNPLFLGLLAFPFQRPYLASLGIPHDKILGVPPVVDFEMFYDRSKNGHDVMNTGAALPKKRMEDFIRAGSLAVGRRFSLYPIGYDVHELLALNLNAGSPVSIHTAVPMSSMPRIYKRHEWMLYTASFDMKTVGWPVAVGEALASGTGVCIANIRPDIRDLVGDAGFVYDSVEEAADIVTRPLPAEVRSRGFERARQMDIHRHKHKLTDLWESVT